MRESEKISYLAWCFLGAFFVFSALTKGLDFFAVSAKIKDYAEVFGVALSNLFLGIGSLFLIGAELSIGLMMIRGLFRRCVYICILFFLVFFLAITLYTAISGSLDDCGCFGSVFSTNPWVSFVKNLFLIIIAVISYPCSLRKTYFNTHDVIMSIAPAVILCGCAIFNQPLKDSTAFAVGDKLQFNAEDITSIDIDFITDVPDDINEFGIVRHMSLESIRELIHVLGKSNHKPIIVTSVASKEVPEVIYDNAIIGFLDNNVLNNIITTDVGIVAIDDNSFIVGKWEEDYFRLQSYTYSDNNFTKIGRILYWVVWIAIIVYVLMLLIGSISRECRKTHNRVGETKHCFYET